MSWQEALAKTFFTEATHLGEDVFFGGKNTKAIVGVGEDALAMQAAGYAENETLQIQMPNLSYTGLSNAPKVNDIIETRGAGYRVHRVVHMEAGQGYDLTCELVPEYVVTEVPRVVTHPQPEPVTNLEVGLLPNVPSELVAISNPVAPTQITVARDPVAPSEVTAEIDYVDLYIVAGQSNAHGHSNKSDLTATEQATIDDVMFFTSWHENTSLASTTQYFSDWADSMVMGKTRGQGTASTFDSNFFGIEWGFARQFKTVNTSQNKLGLVKYAVGATNIEAWDDQISGNCFDGLKAAIADALQKLRQQQKTPVWRGLVWYQGESNGGTQPWNYKDKLDNLVKAIEQEIDTTNLPAVFVAPADGTGSDMLVSGGHVSYARSADFLNYIKASTYHTGTNNNVHLSGQDMLAAGEAVGDAMQAAVTGTATEKEFEPNTGMSFWLDADQAQLVTEDASTHVMSKVEARAGSIDILPRSKDTNLPTIVHEHNAIALRDCFTTSHDREYLETDGDVTMPTSTHDWFIVAKPTTINNGQDSLWATENGRAITLIPVGGNKYTWYWNNTPVSTAQGTSNLQGQLSLFCIRWNFNGSHTSTWFNGTQRDSQRSVGSASNFSMVDLRFHFMAQYGATNATDGNFCEAIVSTATADRSKIEGYLAHKWGISNLLPTSHAYKYYAPEQ